MIPTYLFCSIINVVGIFEEFSSAHTETDSVPLLTMGKLKTTTQFLSVKFETLNDYFCTDIKTSSFFTEIPILFQETVITHHCHSVCSLSTPFYLSNISQKFIF